MAMRSPSTSVVDLTISQAACPMKPTTTRAASGFEQRVPEPRPDQRENDRDRRGDVAARVRGIGQQYLARQAPACATFVGGDDDVHHDCRQHHGEGTARDLRATAVTEPLPLPRARPRSSPRAERRRWPPPRAFRTCDARTGDPCPAACAPRAPRPARRRLRNESVSECRPSETMLTAPVTVAERQLRERRPARLRKRTCTSTAVTAR
jgi:hypothetical protein